MRTVVTDEPDQSQLANDEIIEQVSAPRKKAFQTVRLSLRDYSFRNRVLTAYGRRCAFCDLQMNLIEAAHIVPVNMETSTDETRNGIALCTLHHKAYDVSLVTFDERYRLVTNPQYLEEMKEASLDGGMQKFINNLKPIINVPPESRDRPYIDYLIKANKIRGWSL